MNLKKFFRMLFLGPLIPIIGVPETSDSGNDNTNDESVNESNENTGNEDSNDNTNDSTESTNKDEKLYSAADMEARIQKRLKRDRIQQKKIFDDERAKEKLTDVEKANLERDNARKEADAAIKTANEHLIKATVKEISIKLGIIDSDVAYSIMDRTDVEVEDGKVSGVEESLKELIKQKTYLVKTSSNDNNSNVGDDQTGGSSTKKNDINAWIRKAARGG